MSGGNTRAEDVRIQLLGPVRLVADGAPVALGGAGSRGLLAALALNVNTVVTIEYLIDTLWEHDPPATARTILHGNVSRLRRVLRDVQDHDRTVRVETSHAGYRLAAPPDRVDAHRARALLDESRAASPARRVELLSEALSLWEGESLGGVRRTPANAELGELWRTVHRARVEAELELGRHAELVAELTQLVTDDPAMEGTVGQLMRALYHSGRRGDALDTYRRTANHMANELGLDPAPELTELHERILRDELPHPAGGTRDSGATVDRSFPHAEPMQLPAAVPHLAGRRGDLSWLDAMRSAAERGVATVGVLSGTAGIGKSALLTVWAHRVAESFPDGVLFATLHGFAPGQTPVRTSDVLDQFLCGLGVRPAELPDATRERVALYRSMLAGKTVLVLLDDARTAEQVRPLLPPGGNSMTVVTSRVRLDDLAVSHAARHRVLGTLAPSDAATLVDEVAGPDSTGRNQRIAELCGNLPLAVRVAAARLAAGAQWTADDLVAELADERTRLSALDVEGADSSVRAALDVSYRALPAELAGVLLRIGLPGVDTVTPNHLAVLDGTDVATARYRLRSLAAQNLLVETARDVFAAHDLVRLYVRELAGEHLDTAERERVLDASIRYYLAACDEARRRLLRIVDPLDFRESLAVGQQPVFEGEADATEWYEREWENLLGTLEGALEAGHDERAWQLARIAHTFRVVHPWWEQWSRLLELGLRAAERACDITGRYWMLLSRCAAGLTFGFAEQSHVDGKAALRLAVELDDERLRISAGIHVGCALLLRERFDEAIATLRTVVDRTHELGDRALHGQALNNCAEGEKRAGFHAEAIAHQLDALAIDRDIGDDGYVVVSLNNLAEMYLATGELETAKGYAQSSVKLTTERGFTLQEGVSRRTLGWILKAEGTFQEAYDQLSGALDLHDRVGAREVDAIRAELEELDRPRDLTGS